MDAARVVLPSAARTHALCVESGDNRALGEARRAERPHAHEDGLLDRVGDDAPVDRATERFHPISAAIAVPLFALFAAAVDLRSIDIGAVTGSPILLGVLGGLVVGKPIGILLAARLATALGAKLSAGMRWIDIALVGALGGIGFTVSLLISELAFSSEESLGAAKIGVLIASLAAVALSAVVLALRRSLAR